MTGSSFGPYELLEPLGSGGMGRVYKARDTRAGRTVALKFLPDDLSRAPGAMKRFEREARIIEGLGHPNICSLHEYGLFDDGRAYIAMPFHEGCTLREIIAGGPLRLGEAVSIAMQIARGLERAHAAGIVHRDIKPSNVIVTTEGVAKILDFGAAKEPGDETLTNPDAVLGTIAYMAPEQLRGGEVGRAADVWGLGVVFFEMLTGRRPFCGENLQRLAHGIAHGSSAPAESLDPALGDAGRILVRMLQRNPRARYRSMSEVIEDLERIGYPYTRLERIRRRIGRVARSTAFRLVAGLALAATVTVFALDRIERRKVQRWVHEIAIPAARTHVEEGRSFEAFKVLREVQSVVEDLPEVEGLLAESTAMVTFESDPPGAFVRVRQAAVPDEWIDLGTAPLTVRVPAELCPVEVSLPGYRTRELYYSWPMGTLHVTLQKVGEGPEKMFLVENVSPMWGRLASPAVPFWMDELEVTNREFSAFVQGGGYERSELWTEPILADGKTLSLVEARRRLFVDRTGRPGPSTWSEGVWPEGGANLPVTGVSWYEAAAYCRAAGKELPTVGHWKSAALPAYFFDVADRTGNFLSAGPVTVGDRRRGGAMGGYDLAGNAWEWCWNEHDPGKRYIMGGAWSGTSQSFVSDVAESAWRRDGDLGFRCMKPTAPVDDEMRAPIRQASRDYGSVVPVDDRGYEDLAARYDYERTPLEAVVESVDVAFDGWRVERVSYRTAYGQERMEALLFLPGTAAPPYEAVVFMPNAAPFFRRRPFELSSGERANFLFLVRSGHAVLYPMLYGSYERHFPDYFSPDVLAESLKYTVMDVRRSVDYLQSRHDVDSRAFAYYGWGFGANEAPLILAVEPRFAAAVLVSGGFPHGTRNPAVDPVNFAPRVTQPTLMIGARNDPFCELKEQQIPMFESLGCRAKRHRILDAGRMSMLWRKDELAREALDWLDYHLGPVRPPARTASAK
jgi:eukaryotic-like serine/threonine-protein kinase